MIVAIDFDGTLVQSFKLVDFCLNETFKKYGRKFTKKELKSMRGPTERGILIKALGSKTGKEAFEYYLDIYAKYHKELCPKLTNGALRLLKYLEKNDIITILVTGRSRESYEISSSFFKIRKYFYAIYTGSDKGVNKPESFRKILNLYKISNRELIYVGDSKEDIRSGKAVDIKVLSLTWNSDSRLKELVPLNPGNIYKSFANIKTRIKNELKLEKLLSNEQK